MLASRIEGIEFVVILVFVVQKFAVEQSRELTRQLRVTFELEQFQLVRDCH